MLIYIIQSLGKVILNIQLTDLKVSPSFCSARILIISSYISLSPHAKMQIHVMFP